jgi:hypothetical protein
MGAMPKTAQYTLTDAFMTVLDVWKTDSNKIRLGRYTAPVNGEKKPAAVTMSTIHNCLECEKAEYGGGAGCRAVTFSTSKFEVCVVGETCSVDEADIDRKTAS